MACEANSAKEARDLAWLISHTGRRKDLDTLLAIPPYPGQETSDTKPAKAFFVNQRTDLLVSKAEIDRMDYRKSEGRSIFLAENKYWLGIESKTTIACSLVLVGCMSLCLLLTTIFLQRRSQRVH